MYIFWLLAPGSILMTVLEFDLWFKRRPEKHRDILKKRRENTHQNMENNFILNIARSQKINQAPIWYICMFRRYTDLGFRTNKIDHSENGQPSLANECCQKTVNLTQTSQKLVTQLEQATKIYIVTCLKIVGHSKNTFGRVTPLCSPRSFQYQPRVYLDSCWVQFGVQICDGLHHADKAK